MGLGVGLIGSGYMGKCHALAWTSVATVFSGIERPRLVALADATDELAQKTSPTFRLRQRHGRLARSLGRRFNRCDLYCSPQSVSRGNGHRRTGRWQARLV